ncbi:MAG TPA: type II toxin-antitoxin system RelE/ParE family toxin [Allosphingosinicella sp.]|nr:type II toxin-antitoxin system RelE/ParE family toxin [Allosphingosinicella sp.]
MIVRLTPEALKDLVEIWFWIAREDENRADAFVDELQRACDSLFPRPWRFPVALDLDGDPVRKRLYRGHLVFYRVLPEEVEVVRVIHAARDWMALLQVPRSRK